MEKILKEISMVPGVIGSCIVGENQQTKCSDLAEHFSSDFSQTVGSHVTRLIQMSTMAELEVKIVSFRYDRYTVIGIPQESGAILLSVCEAQANCSLVATTASMLSADIKKVLEEQGEEPLAEAELAEEQGAPESQLEEEVNEELLTIFETIQDSLARVIGPVAGMIMEDTLATWRANGPAEKERLSELIDLLVVEINDSSLAKEFTAGLHTFRSYSKTYNLP